LPASRSQRRARQRSETTAYKPPGRVYLDTVPNRRLGIRRRSAMRITSAVLVLFVAGATVAAQKTTLKLEPVERQMPAYIVERLSSSDRVLFGEVMPGGLGAGGAVG